MFSFLAIQNPDGCPPGEWDACVARVAARAFPWAKDLRSIKWVSSSGTSRLWTWSNEPFSITGGVEIITGLRTCLAWLRWTWPFLRDYKQSYHVHHDDRACGADLLCRAFGKFSSNEQSLAHCAPTRKNRTAWFRLRCAECMFRKRIRLGRFYNEQNAIRRGQYGDAKL